MFLFLESSQSFQFRPIPSTYPAPLSSTACPPPPSSFTLPTTTQPLLVGIHCSYQHVGSTVLVFPPLLYCITFLKWDVCKEQKFMEFTVVKVGEYGALVRPSWVLPSQWGPFEKKCHHKTRQQKGSASLALTLSSSLKNFARDDVSFPPKGRPQWFGHSYWTLPLKDFPICKSLETKPLKTWTLEKQATCKPVAGTFWCPGLYGPWRNGTPCPRRHKTVWRK